MPLKRIYCKNEGKRLHQRAVNGLFCYVGGLSERKPKGSSQEPPRNAATEAHNLPTFCHSISKILLLLPFLVSEIPEETLSHPKK